MSVPDYGSRWPVLVALGNAALLVTAAVGIFAITYRLRGPEGEFAAGPPTAPTAPPSADSPPQTVEMTIPGMPSADAPRKPDAKEEIVIDLDREGKIRFEGEPMELAMLRTRLCEFSTDLRRRVLVTIRPADDCLFRYVKDVIRVCDECVISSYKVSGPPAHQEATGPKPNETSAV